MQRSNIAARAGRWSAQHRRTAILGWLGFVIAAVALGSAIGTKQISQNSNGVGESGRAQQILHDRFPQRANEQVLIQSTHPDRARRSVRRCGSRRGRTALRRAHRPERPLATQSG